MIDAHAIGRADALLEPRDVCQERIEQAARLRSAARRAAALPPLAEEPVEDDARMRLGGSGVVGDDQERQFLIDARVAVVAHAGERVQIHRELERRQLRLAADLLRRDLVDRRAEKVVRALGVFGERRAQESGVRGVVRAG